MYSCIPTAGAVLWPKVDVTGAESRQTDGVLVSTDVRPAAPSVQVDQRRYTHNDDNQHFTSQTRNALTVYDVIIHIETRHNTVYSALCLTASAVNIEVSTLTVA